MATTLIILLLLILIVFNLHQSMKLRKLDWKVNNWLDRVNKLVLYIEENKHNVSVMNQNYELTKNYNMLYNKYCDLVEMNNKAEEKSNG